ncbi:hypothetical protein HPB49_016811 [Dermacentor silvarum]|uniref:Uncharacterized protein n=1 Tax=Dermacentor silvarum TaxID=543639 RepID=A0ACB8E1G4_DERSI|nr:uncharacterized protein LOC125942599 [Dermacentor silvarum]KAH7980512.1 hypothetical protein HPB49_016811 [Dermacentor silvarum]
MEDSNSDWAPSQHLGYGGDDRGALKRTERYERTKRYSRKVITTSASELSSLSAVADTSVPHSTMNLAAESGPTLPGGSLDEGLYKDATVQTELTMADLQAIQAENERLTCCLPSVVQQKEHLKTVSQTLDTDNQRLAEELRRLAAEKEKLEISEASLRQDNAKVLFIQG